MTITNIQIALEKSLNAITPALSTRWPNTRLIKTLPYQEVYFLHAPPVHDELGTGVHRIDGLLQVSLFYELLNGKSDMMARAELIRSAFPRGSSHSHGGTDVIIIRSPHLKQIQEDEDSVLLPIDIEFFSYIT